MRHTAITGSTRPVRIPTSVAEQPVTGPRRRLTLILVFVAVSADASVPLVVAAATAGHPIALFLNTTLYFGVLRPQLRPAWRRLHFGHARDLFRLGATFFALSILTSIATTVDNPLIARVLGLEAVTEYAVTYRLFSLLSLFVLLVVQPLWPANGEALAVGDVAWVRRTTRRMVTLTAGGVALTGTVLFVCRDSVLAIWLGGNQHLIPWHLGVTLVVWSILLGSTSPLFMVQNSVGVLRHQLVGWCTFLVLSVTLKLLMLRAFGLTGAPLAACVVYLCVLVPTAWLGYRSAVTAAEASSRSQA